jgi:type VI secretion system protein ImpG
MAVARLFPGSDEGNLAEGLHIARGASFISGVLDGENTPCQFRSSQDVTLYPLEITGARLTGIPPDIPSLDRYVRHGAEVRGALRLRLRTTNSIPIASLQGLNRLPVYLAGDERTASHLFELLHAAGLASIIGEPGQFGTPGSVFHAVSDKAVVHEGLDAGQGLLPLVAPKFHGHNLLHEFAACPSRFYFFTLTGLNAGLRQVRGCEAEIVVLLERSPGALAEQVDASQFALFCTPVINLFRKHTDQIELSEGDTEFRIVPARLHPLDYEVFAVEKLSGQVTTTSAEREFRPLFQTLNNDEGNYGRYFSTRRERRLISDSARRYGTRTPYIGTEMFVSLVDQHEAPYSEEIRYLSVDAWVTNRDLPNLVPRDGVNDLAVADADAVASTGLIRAPSVPRAPYAEREMAWRLIRQLNFNYLPLDDLDHREGGQGLRDLLRLFLAADDTEHRRQVESLVGVKTRPVARKLPGGGPLVFGRGIECALTVDETGFSGTSPYLFGLILEHYLTRHVSVNSFTQTELHSMQRGRVANWPVRMGTRGIV